MVSTKFSSTHWEPVTFMSKSEYCPEAFEHYAVPAAKNKGFWKEKVLKHLVFLGWKVEFTENYNGDGLRYRYKSPGEKKKIYYSLLKLCKDMQQQNQSNTNCDVVPRMEKMIPDLEDDTDDSPIAGEKVHCFEAVVRYYITQRFEKKTMSRGEIRILRSKAKNHLLAEGWVLQDPPEDKKRMGIRYFSPKEKKRFQTLYEACGFCIEESVSLDGKKVDLDHALSEESLRTLLLQLLLPKEPLPELHTTEPELHTTETVSVNSLTGNYQKECAREIIEEPSKNVCEPENDSVCSVCNYGGELILCDHCPSSFHTTCLYLEMEDIPDGDWFCPYCRCGICGQGGTNKDEGGDFLTCTQCEHKYHTKCLKNRDTGKSRRYMEKGFCGDRCEKIFEGLQRLLGQSVSVGEDNLTWTLMKLTNSKSCDHFLVETYNKLKAAVSLMHECFEPVKQSSSNRDVVEDVIFSRRSDRLNFQGFYTVLLEKNEELVSVATIRVYGDKVAEVPLVGTSFKYRRQGMCHILMNELEKKLVQLGVEQLVLPAVPSVVETWTGSFGFTKMTSSERSKILDCNFLDFQDTIMCEKKLLNKHAITDSQLTMVKEKEPSHEFEDQQCKNGTLLHSYSRKWDVSCKNYKRRKVEIEKA